MIYRDKENTVFTENKKDLGDFLDARDIIMKKANGNIEKFKKMMDEYVMTFTKIE